MDTGTQPLNAASREAWAGGGGVTERVLEASASCWSQELLLLANG